MRLSLDITDDDIGRLRSFCGPLLDHPLVVSRRARNVDRLKRKSVTREHAWHVQLACLLTSQQSSGEDSRVKRLLDASPFSLELSRCKSHRSPATYIERQLKSHGGIRFRTTIGKRGAANLPWFEKSGWSALTDVLSSLADSPSRDAERESARWVQARFDGMGPKQSRNFLQWLGLTRYEVPLDSRFVRWGKRFGFPVPLSSTALADPGYYEFVLDQLQRLCDAAGMFPCILDAAIFAQKEPRTWTGGFAD